MYSGSEFSLPPFLWCRASVMFVDNFLLFAAGISNPADPAPAGQGHCDNSSTHSCIFFDANVALVPNALSLGVAASMLAFNLPEGFVNTSRVVVGDRSDRISSVMRVRVGDREGVRVCAPETSRGAVEERSGGSMVIEVDC